MTRSTSSPLVSSVALAYELYIPLAAAGLGLTTQAPHLWPDGLVVFIVHLAGRLYRRCDPGHPRFPPIDVIRVHARRRGGAGGCHSADRNRQHRHRGPHWGSPAHASAYPTTATLTLIPTATPTFTPTLTPVPPTATPTLTPTATQTPVPTATITPTLPPCSHGIARSAGGGARLRAEPYGTTVTTMNNGTLVLVLSDQFVVAGNMTWVNVRIMPDGLEGWVLQELLIMATPSPNW